MRAAPICVAATWLVLCQPCAGLAQVSYDDIVKATFQNAIVKISVSIPQPIIRDGKSICVSHGTGFFITGSHIVTASHVFDIPSECGPPTIVVSSRRFDVRKLAKEIGRKGDIALLQIDALPPQDMCSLVVRREDAFSTEGYRLGIPGALQDPVPAAVRIGEKSSEFSPLVRLTGSTAEPGESGGPVLIGFNVVGVLKARHENYIDYSFMMMGSQLRELLSEARVVQNGKICNPVEYFMSADARAIILQPNSSLPENAQAEILKQIEAVSKAYERSSQVLVHARPLEKSVSLETANINFSQQVCRPFPDGRTVCTRVQRTGPDIRSSTEAARSIADQINNQILERTEFMKARTAPAKPQ